MLHYRSKPLIGVSGPIKGGEILWWFLRFSLWLAGGQARRITSLQSVSLEAYSGFIIAGGADINPEMYGEAAVAKAVQYDLVRDSLEQDLIHYAVKYKKPLLGICRGMQILNVTLGGSLYQEAKDVLEGFLPSQSLIGKLIGRREVIVDKSSHLFKILGEHECYSVNSIHHQAVNKLGEGFVIVAKEENGLIQAIEQANKAQQPFMLGVQWHPELMLHTSSARKLFKALVRAARE